MAVLLDLLRTMCCSHSETATSPRQAPCPGPHLVSWKGHWRRDRGVVSVSTALEGPPGLLLAKRACEVPRPGQARQDRAPLACVASLWDTKHSGREPRGEGHLGSAPAKAPSLMASQLPRTMAVLSGSASSLRPQSWTGPSPPLGHAACPGQPPPPPHPVCALEPGSHSSGRWASPGFHP